MHLTGESFQAAAAALTGPSKGRANSRDECGSSRLGARLELLCMTCVAVAMVLCEDLKPENLLLDEHSSQQATSVCRWRMSPLVRGTSASRLLILGSATYAASVDTGVCNRVCRGRMVLRQSSSIYKQCSELAGLHISLRAFPVAQRFDDNQLLRTACGSPCLGPSRWTQGANSFGAIVRSDSRLKVHKWCGKATLLRRWSRDRAPHRE